MNRKTLAAILVALTVLAPAIGGMAAASQTVAFDGEATGTADQVSPTQIQVGSSLNNTTVQMTEDQTVSASGSTFYTTNVTPEGAVLDAMASGENASNIAVNVVDNGVYVNNSGANSETTSSVNITFGVSDNVSSNGSVADAINVTAANAMANKTQLVADSDSSEVQNYRVYGAGDGDVLDWSFSVDNGEINASTGNYVPNETGQANFSITVTRNNTTYESLSLEDHLVYVSFDKSGFADIAEETNETAGRLVLDTNGIDDFSSDGDEDKGYKFRMVQQNNTTRTYTLKFNVTVENADENQSFTVESIHDPKGGVKASAGVSYGLHNAGGTSNFVNVPLDMGSSLLLGGIAIILVVGGIFYASDMKSGFRGFGAFGPGGMGTVYNALWIVGILAGLSMIIGPITPFWNGLVVEGIGLPTWAPMVLGFVISVGSVGFAVRKNLEG